MNISFHFSSCLDNTLLLEAAAAVAENESEAGEGEDGDEDMAVGSNSCCCCCIVVGVPVVGVRGVSFPTRRIRLVGGAISSSCGCGRGGCAFGCCCAAGFCSESLVGDRIIPSMSMAAATEAWCVTMVGVVAGAAVSMAERLSMAVLLLKY